VKLAALLWVTVINFGGRGQVRRRKQAWENVTHTYTDTRMTYAQRYVLSYYRYKQHHAKPLELSTPTLVGAAPYCDATSALASGLDGGYPIPWRVEGKTAKTTLATAPTTTGSAMTTFFCWSLSDG
jgi:hypothetical protein